MLLFLCILTEWEMFQNLVRSTIILIPCLKGPLLVPSGRDMQVLGDKEIRRPKEIRIAAYI